MRSDLKIIGDIIEPGSRVIDIGCGEGDLLAYLAMKKQVDGRGLEISQQRVSVAVGKGLSVVQGDANTDLKYYPENSFDYAILGQTLQAMDNPRKILEEMLRIAKHVVVSIPNFGHIRNRLYLLLNGRMPVTKALCYEWYETPNIHFCTIKDFLLLCRSMNIKVEKKMFLTSKGQVHGFTSKFLMPANLFGEQGIFLLGRK